MWAKIMSIYCLNIIETHVFLVKKDKVQHFKFSYVYDIKLIYNHFEIIKTELKKYYYDFLIVDKTF